MLPGKGMPHNILLEHARIHGVRVRAGGVLVHSVEGCTEGMCLAQPCVFTFPASRLVHGCWAVSGFPCNLTFWTHSGFAVWDLPEALVWAL